MIILTFLLPMTAGALLPLFRLGSTSRRVYVAIVSAAACALAVSSSIWGSPVTIVTLADGLTISYNKDSLAALFAVLFSLCWLIVSIYAPTYIQHEGHDDRFFAFFLLSLGAMLSLSFSSNLLTLYLSFELVTLLSVPLVLHEETKESIAAALKYLFYSIAGALFGLFGIIFIYSYTNSGAFSLGGTLTEAGPYLPLAVFFCIIGFGTKAGMYPMHGWLPSAHPVAPAPASALLSGIIAKAGVLAVIRVVFYTVGADAVRGTWVMTAWMALAAITVLMGSMMAFREDILKKRLAYSTVSNISYIMLGLATLTATGELGALLHLIAHAFAKNALFLAAGSIIYKTGKTRVSELSGIGRQMPVTLGAFTVASLSLIGIPPLLGFISKWFLASSGVVLGGAAAVIVPAVLIISALLTAGYLLPVVIDGFFPKKDAVVGSYCEAPVSMTLPAVVFAALSLIFGVLGGPLSGIIAEMI